MLALRVGEGGVAVDEVPAPLPAGEALIRVSLSGVCNTDLELVRGYAGFRGTLGHEFVGVVEDDGGGPFARGERVVGEINAGCGTCARCAAGDPRHCPTRTVLGIVGRDGAHAELVRLPARNLFRVPAAVSDRRAVFVEPLAAACGVLERCPLERGMRVAVVGDGKLGLLCALVLQHAGFAPVLFGRHAAKLGIAGGCGVATRVVRGPEAPRAFDVAVECSGAPGGLELALSLLVPQGRLVLKSTFHGLASFDTARVVVDELQLIGSRCGRFPPALALLEQAGDALPVEQLVSAVLPLAQGVQALERAAAPGVLKVLLSR
ncbi:MAG: alcohol dehydrogenase catalytic domain-containing protein [Myxococcaceae bacterium]|nr:alcohol dehydrogenase catalytic domain-containing protein [Myxococcaceae bacterium]